MRTIFFLSITLKCIPAFSQPPRVIENHDKISIVAEIPPDFHKKTIKLGGYPAPSVTIKSSEEFVLEQPINKSTTLRWEVADNRPHFIYGDFIKVPGNIINYLAEPGDKVSVIYEENGQPSFSGVGALKFELITRLAIIIDSFEKSPGYFNLSSMYSPVNSFDDFRNWHSFLNNQLLVAIPLIDSYQGSISEFAYMVIKENVINEIETRRLEKFRTLCFNNESPSSHHGFNQFGLSNKDLCRIYDSTQNGNAAEWLQFNTKFVSFAYYYYIRSSTDAFREKGKFFKEKQSDSAVLGNDRIDGYVYRYNIVKKKYKGKVREAALAFFFHFPKGVLKSIGFAPKIESLLKDYYENSEFPEYAQKVKEFEMQMRELKTGIRDLDFELKKTDNSSLSKSQLNGKVTLIDFWFTGCTGCIQMVPALQQLEDHFNLNEKVQFVNVSIDKDKGTWHSSLQKKKYTTGTGLCLYTGGSGSDHPLIKNYLISSYPSLILFDAYGRSISPDQYKDPRKDSGNSLINVINKRIALMNDGPYVYYQKNSTDVFQISGKIIDSSKATKESLITVRFTHDSSFTFKLKKELKNEASDYSMPSRLLALSDIEGNFSAFKNLLIANGVINSSLEWTFGNGHLVFCGDMFDRGEQVTECLWLLYSLEEKAAQSGGYVHYILGNHEIMNLQGNNKYTQIKYKQNASLLNKNLKELYDYSSELGRWLRTKNIIEKIGNIIFVHGGVSKGINSLRMTTEELNNTARKYYSSFQPEQATKTLKTIMNDRSGLFWSREYYSLDTSKVDLLLNETLKNFSADHIVTGHTIISDHISMLFKGKLINIDTKHTAGKSEALLIENGNFYAVGSQGTKRLIYFSQREAK